MVKRKQYLPDAYAERHRIVERLMQIYCLARIVDIMMITEDGRDGQWSLAMRYILGGRYILFVIMF